MIFNDEIYRKYKCVRPLGTSTYEVLGNDIAVVKIINLPKNQSEVFDLLMKDMDLGSVEMYYKKQADTVTKQLERFAYLKEDSHIFRYDEFDVSKIPGGTGWRIKILKDKQMTLKEYTKVHAMTKEEIVHMGIHICDALIDGLNAGYHHGHICPENIYITAKDNYLLDDFALHDGDDMMDLTKLLNEMGVNVPQAQDPWKMKERLYEIQ